MKGYPEIIEKIHKEYNEASDKLVEEALSIINNIKINEDKHAKLKILGLTNTPEFKALESEHAILVQKKGITNLIDLYNKKYPHNKFISTQDVITINKKYGLILGGLNDFKGFVPQTNLDDIVKFKETYLDNKIIPYHVEVSKCQYISDIRMAAHNKKIMSLFKYNKAIDIYVNSGSDPDKSPISFKRRILDELYSVGFPVYDMIQEYESYVLNFSIKEPVLCICATGKEMGLTEAQTKKFSTGLFDFLKSNQKEYKFEVKADPIVLHPVKDGYIIVTAWGDEASDPLVVNHNNN